MTDVDLEFRFGPVAAQEMETVQRVWNSRRSGGMLAGVGIEKAMSQFNGVISELPKRMNSTRIVYIDTAGKEEAVKDVIDKISADITAAGGKIETV